MATVEKMPMLQEGYDKLTADLKRLKAERPLIVDAIEEARAHGDLSENAEYHAAKERQGQIEATIADIEDKLSRAQVIDPTELSGDKVVFGATVTLLDEDEKPVRYQIVGQTEADAKNGADQLQFAARPRADRPQGRRRGRGDGARGRPLLPRHQDRVHLTRSRGRSIAARARDRRAGRAGDVRLGLLVVNAKVVPALGVHPGGGGGAGGPPGRAAVWLTPLARRWSMAAGRLWCSHRVMLVFCGRQVERALGAVALVALLVAPMRRRAVRWCGARGGAR